MRTTLTIDDHIARDLKELAHRTGKPFNVVLNEALKAGLIAGAARRQARPYVLKPTAMGNVRAGLNLDNAMALADSLEDQDLA